jgi:hypothetical protein
VNTQFPENALLQLIDRQLRNGATIEIEGLGMFEHDKNQQIIFRPHGESTVFLGYAREDRQQITRLYRELQNAGLSPWMDTQALLPGQNWRRAIEQTIEVSDFFVGCFSSNSVSKRGHFQSELAHALEVSKSIPLDHVFFVPVRLDDCDLPGQVVSNTHYVDLFPNWKRGVNKLISAIRRYQTANHKKQN